MSVKKIIENVYFAEGSTNIGIIEDDFLKNNSELYLIDSGMDNDDAKRIFDEIKSYFDKENKNFTIKAIINTHSHADHAGGNNFFYKKYNCDIYSTFNESGSMINPFLQSAIVWGGNPICELRSSYYQMEVSTPNKLITKDLIINLKNKIQLSFVPLPGHYFEMVGVKIKNNQNKTALFTGDAYFGREHIFKYWISFIYNVNEFKKTLDMLTDFKSDFFIPSHGQVQNEIQEILEVNKMAVLSNEICILNILKQQDLTFEDIFKEVCNQNEIKLKVRQYALIGCTIKSYLTSLADEKKLNYYVKDNKMYWHKIN